MVAVREGTHEVVNVLIEKCLNDEDASVDAKDNVSLARDFWCIFFNMDCFVKC